eukprot:g4118.t1
MRMVLAKVGAARRSKCTLTQAFSSAAVAAGGGGRKRRRLAQVPAVWPLSPDLPQPPPFSSPTLGAADRIFGRHAFERVCRARDPVELPQHAPDGALLPEVVVLGRSNVGKSSLLNALWQQPGLAPASKTPGRTRTFDVYCTHRIPELRVLDVPGYGFARAPKAIVADWHAMLGVYLQERGARQVARAYVLLDARRGVTRHDHEVIEVLDGSGVLYQLVLTKADTLGPTALRAAVAGVQRDVGAVPEHVGCYPAIHVVSAAKQHGLSELRASVALSLQLLDEEKPELPAPRLEE